MWLLRCHEDEIASYWIFLLSIVTDANCPRIKAMPDSHLYEPRSPAKHDTPPKTKWRLHIFGQPILRCCPGSLLRFKGPLVIPNLIFPEAQSILHRYSRPAAHPRPLDRLLKYLLRELYIIESAVSITTQ